ncbi:MAG: hypothetical protein Q7S57_03740 [bacterium]|nr:hypothetical protein [bacterium]
MKTSITATLSAKATTARAEFLKIMKTADQIGWQECYDAIQGVVGALDADTQAELQQFLVGIKPETARMRIDNAARVLEDLGEYSLAFALKGEVVLTNVQAIAMFEPFVAGNNALPEWIRGALNVRLGAVKAMIERAKLPPVPPKSAVPADPLPGLRKQFEQMLDRMEHGHFCNGDFHVAETKLTVAQRDELADLIKKIRDEIEPCYLRARTNAGEMLETVGHDRAAEALYDDEADPGVLHDALRARNVHGWVKGLINHRIYQLEKLARAREQVARLTETDVAVAKVAELVGRVIKIGDQAAEFSVMGPTLLKKAEEILEEAQRTEVHYGLLEGLIADQGGEKSFVSRMLRDVEAMAMVVDKAVEKTKAAAFHRELLRPAREAVEAMRTEFGEANQTEPEPVVQKAEPVKQNGKKKFHPNLLANHVDSPRHSRHGVAR